MLNGIGRCGICGGALNVMGNLRVPRYFCLTRNRRGPAACSNGHGVPMREFDEAVMAQIHATLFHKPAVAAALIEDRIAQARRDQAHHAGHTNVRPAIARLEAEIGRLVTALATGTATTDVTAAIPERRAEVERLRPAVPAEPPALDRAACFEP